MALPRLFPARPRPGLRPGWLLTKYIFKVDGDALYCGLTQIGEDQARS